jgi:hypothetical protein
MNSQEAVLCPAKREIFGRWDPEAARGEEAKPVTQKVPASYGDQCGTGLCSTLLAREALSWLRGGQGHSGT